MPAGVVFGFLGPNGAGKTTMIRLLLGLLEPSSGKASVVGFDTRSQGEQVRSHCGVLLDEPGLYERLSAEENLEFYGRIWGMAPAERAGRIQGLLTHIGLWDRRAETVATWSLGMRKKLALARAVLHRPPVLFLDEPTTGLDPIARAALRTDITSLAGTLLANIGVLASLRAPSAMAAQKAMALGVIGLVAAGAAVSAALPDTWKTDLEHLADEAGTGSPLLVAAGAAALLLLNWAVFSMAARLFRRPKLIRA